VGDLIYLAPALAFSAAPVAPPTAAAMISSNLSEGNKLRKMVVSNTVMDESPHDAAHSRKGGRQRENIVPRQIFRRQLVSQKCKKGFEWNAKGRVKDSLGGGVSTHLGISALQAAMKSLATLDWATAPSGRMMQVGRR
jgi:hypothetical protein